MTSLEQALMAAGARLSQSELGAWMWANHPGRRDSTYPDSKPSQLAMFELNSGPPVYRTLSVLMSAQATRRDLGQSDVDRAYVAKVGDLTAALRAVADKFWGDIRADVRTLAFDYDNVRVPSRRHPYIVSLRDRPGPSLRTSCTKVGLGDLDIAAVASCWHAAHQTEVFEAAKTAATRIGLHDRLRRQLLERRNDLASRSTEMMGQGQTMQEVEARTRGIVVDGYRDAPAEVMEAADHLRSYNELVQVILWTLLGYCEGGLNGIPVVPTDIPRANVEHTWRHLRAQFTVPHSSQPWFPQRGGPFVVTGRGLLDGLYICDGFAFRGIGEGGFTDVTGLSVRELERGP